MAGQNESLWIEGLPLGTKSALEELARKDGKSFDEYVRTVVATVISRALRLKEVKYEIALGLKELDEGKSLPLNDETMEGIKNRIRERASQGSE